MEFIVIIENLKRAKGLISPFLFYLNMQKAYIILDVNINLRYNIRVVKIKKLFVLNLWTENEQGVDHKPKEA